MSININLQRQPQSFVEKTDDNDVSDNCNSPSKSRTKWRRLSNLFKSINQLNKHETKHISSDCEIEKEIIQHKEKLYVKRNSMLSAERSILQQQTTGNQPVVIAPLFQNITNKEMYKLSLKENCLKLITDGDPKVIEKLKEIFSKDPDKLAIGLT
jgi:hypothetical protein